MLIISQNLETDKTSENYNLKKMENKMIKDHTIKSDEHEMRVDGQFLKEKKVTTFIDGCKDELDATEIAKYFRSIENDGQTRHLEITENFCEGFITGFKAVECEIENGDPRHCRQMTEDEIEQFVKDWDRLSCLAFLNSHPHYTQMD